MARQGDKRKATVQGVKDVEQVNMGGSSWYTTVDGRIKIANEADPKQVMQPERGYTVCEYRVVQMGERWAYMCLIEYPVGSGHTFPGSDFIDMRDASGLAKAETSAVGRALGLAGIAIDEGIASAEEMQRHGAQPAATTTATPESAKSDGQPQAPVQLKPWKQGGTVNEQMQTIVRRAHDVGADTIAKWSAVFARYTGKTWGTAGLTVTQSEVDILRNWVISRELRLARGETLPDVATELAGHTRESAEVA